MFWVNIHVLLTDSYSLPDIALVQTSLTLENNKMGQVMAKNSSNSQLRMNYLSWQKAEKRMNTSFKCFPGQFWKRHSIYRADIFQPQSVIWRFEIRYSSNNYKLPVKWIIFWSFYPKISTSNLIWGRKSSFWPCHKSSYSRNLKWKILESIIVIVKFIVINYSDGNTRNVISWSLMSKLLSQV